MEISIYYKCLNNEISFKAYFAKGKDNVLLADWSDAAALDYPTSRKAIGQVAKHFAKQLKEFLE